jgi:putative transcription factor
MDCEVCGKSFTGKPFEVRIEGSLMRTCSGCARFGREEKGWSRLPQKGGGSRWESQPVRKPVPAPREKVIEVVENYHEAIRRAREMRGLNREDFAKIMNEKASVIVRLESGSLSPDEKLAKKLERLLDIKLLQASEEAPHDAPRGGKRGEPTIGDALGKR